MVEGEEDAQTRREGKMEDVARGNNMEEKREMEWRMKVMAECLNPTC